MRKNQKTESQINKFKIIIEQFHNQYEADKGVNEFIEECSTANCQILDITSHITESSDGITTYVFIYKVTKN